MAACLDLGIARKQGLAVGTARLAEVACAIGGGCFAESIACLLLAGTGFFGKLVIGAASFYVVLACESVAGGICIICPRVGDC